MFITPVILCLKIVIDILASVIFIKDLANIKDIMKPNLLLLNLMVLRAFLEPDRMIKFTLLFTALIGLIYYIFYKFNTEKNLGD